MKTKLLLLLMVLIPLSCAPEGLENVSWDDISEVEHDMIVLGDKLDDPYSLGNMEKALIAVYGTKAIREPLKATDIYVRFLPENADQLKTLEDADLHLYDHPLDYEIIREGDYYHDPSIDSDKITWQYAVVSPEFEYPKGIRYEILDECYIPSASSSTRGLAEGVDWNVVEREAFYITGNEDMLAPQSRATATNPEGRMVVLDDNYNGGKPVPLAGVKVVVNSFVKFAAAYTDEEGYYHIKKEYSSKIRYRVMFRNSKGFGIGMNLLLVPASVSALGKAGPDGMDVQIDKNSDRKLFSRAVVNNAAFDYFQWCASKDVEISAPPANLRLWLFQKMESSSAVMLQQGCILDSGQIASFLGEYAALVKLFLPDITMGLKYLDDYEDIYSATIHELAHASHFSKAGKNYWTQYAKYIIKSYLSSGGVLYGGGRSAEGSGYCEVGEMWAYYLQNQLHKKRYGEYIPELGTSFWFFPQIFLYLDERGLDKNKIFKALNSNVNSRESLEAELINLYPENRSIIEQAFIRYGE